MLNDSETIRTILTSVRTIAVVGLSADSYKASHYVSAYMQDAGYRIIPVNPTLSGTVLGEQVYPDLASIAEPVDLVNVFRRSSECAAVVEQAIAIGAKAVWTQLGVVCTDAAAKAHAAGLMVVMNRCLKIEHAQLT